MPYDFEHGSGTEADPYLIATEADLWGIFDVNSDDQPNFVGNYFRQTADITITQSVSTNILIRCVYDGNNHRISGLKTSLASLGTSTWKNSIFLNCTNEDLESWEYPTVFQWIFLEEEGVGENKLDNIQLLNSPGIYIFAGQNIVATNLIVKNSGGFAGGTILDSKISECYGENLAFTQQSRCSGAGAFCDVFGCSFENIVIRNVEYEDEYWLAGGMVGKTSYSNFKNCVVLGAKVIGEDSSGGFAGQIFGGTFEDCFALGVTVEVRPGLPNQPETWPTWHSGGFAGEIFANRSVGDPDYVPFVFRRCIVHGTADVDATAGGFAGAIWQEGGSFFEQCGAEVSVINTNENAGGFAGEIWGSLDSLEEGAVCKDCYALGDSVLSNLENAISNGGFVGVADKVIFERCFSKGLVSGGTNKGGFCGLGYDDIECIDCYYDSETSGQSDTSMGTPKTTAEMKTQSTFSG
ncbi:MAG: hypothetical protein PHW28_07585, partial [Mesotoga sp.]|nr:hypothetical protein [Mesotoga sp.]